LFVLLFGCFTEPEHWNLAWKDCALQVGSCFFFSRTCPGKYFIKQVGSWIGRRERSTAEYQTTNCHYQYRSGLHRSSSMNQDLCSADEGKHAPRRDTFSEVVTHRATHQQPRTNDAAARVVRQRQNRHAPAAIGNRALRVMAGSRSCESCRRPTIPTSHPDPPQSFVPQRRPCWRVVSPPPALPPPDKS
jgi:hypothetical protein